MYNAFQCIYIDISIRKNIFLNNKYFSSDRIGAPGLWALVMSPVLWSFFIRMYLIQKRLLSDPGLGQLKVSDWFWDSVLTRLIRRRRHRGRAGQRPRGGQAVLSVQMILSPGPRGLLRVAVRLTIIWSALLPGGWGWPAQCPQGPRVLLSGGRRREDESAEAAYGVGDDRVLVNWRVGGRVLLSRDIWNSNIEYL